MKGIDSKYYEQLKYETKFSYTDYNLNKLIQTCTELTEQYILNYGGKIEEGQDGKIFYKIPKKNLSLFYLTH